MDLMHLPTICYFFDPRQIFGTYLFGFLGVLVCCVFCAIAWWQIKKDGNELGW